MCVDNSRVGRFYRDVDDWRGALGRRMLCPDTGGKETQHMSTQFKPTNLIPASDTAAEHNVSVRTLNRWLGNPDLHFPRPIRINNRRYFLRGELDQWKVERAQASREE